MERSVLARRDMIRTFCIACLASLVGLIGCSADQDLDDSSGSTEPGQSLASQASGLTGCRGKASSTIPAGGVYYLTTFGNGRYDNGTMSCGEDTRSGSWYYAASRQRYGCGSHVRIEANGKCVIAETDDYGPDVCVERAAGREIMDVSPLVAKQLFGRSSAGYSDRLKVTVTEVSSSTPLGPCSGSGNTTGGGTSCSYPCDDYNYAEGECYDGWKCVSGCLKQATCGQTCDYPCAEYNFSEGQCHEHWKCSGGCLVQNGC